MADLLDDFEAEPEAKPANRDLLADFDAEPEVKPTKKLRGYSQFAKTFGGGGLEDLGEAVEEAAPAAMGGVVSSGTLGFADELGAFGQKKLAESASAINRLAPGALEAVGISRHFGSAPGDEPEAVYKAARDENRGEDKRFREAHPIAYTAGGIAPALLIPGGGLKGAVGMGALTGLGTSEEEGLGGQLEDAALGAGFGAAAHGVGSVIGKGLGALAGKLSPKLREAAALQADRAGGMKLKDYRALGKTAEAAREAAVERGNTLLDRGAVGFGSNVEDVAERLGPIREKAGEEVGDIVSELDALRSAGAIPTRVVKEPATAVIQPTRVAPGLQALPAGQSAGPNAVTAAGPRPSLVPRVAPAAYEEAAATMPGTRASAGPTRVRGVIPEEVETVAGPAVQRQRAPTVAGRLPTAPSAAAPVAESAPEITAIARRLGISPAVAQRLAAKRPASVGVDPQAVADRIERELIDPLRGRPGRRAVMRKLEDEVAELRASSKKPWSFKEASTQKNDYDELAKWNSSQAVQEQQGARAMKALQGVIRGSIDDEAEKLSPELAQKYKSARALYGQLKPAELIAQDAAARNLANRAISPSDYIAGAGQMAATGNPLVAAVTALLHKQIRTRGNSAAAVSARALANALDAGTLGKYAGPLARAAARGPQALEAAHGLLLKNDPEYRATLDAAAQPTQQQESSP